MTEAPDLSILGYDFRASGVVRNALRIAGAAQAAGLRTEIWAVRARGPLRAEVPAGVAVREAGLPGEAGSRSLELFKALPALAHYLAEHRPRIALSSGNHMHTAAALAYRRAGRPPAVALWARASNATLKHPIEGYLGRPLPGVARHLVDRLNRLQYAPFHHIIAVSQELGTELATDLGIGEERLTVIANGVDVATIARLAGEPVDHPWLRPGELPVVVSAGRLSRQKNFVDLVRAVAVVRRRKPVRLVILGDGPEDRRARLRDEAHRLGLGDAVLVPGFEANPFRWMAGAAVFVISSRWEGASNVVLEALACGTPVVAYDCPTGLREVLEPLDAQSLVAPGDSEALGHAIVDRLERPRNSEIQRQRAENYRLEVTLAAYVDCFRRALAGR
jgi:glycosyltransferase involved in cell wall biosynthesis